MKLIGVNLTWCILLFFSACSPLTTRTPTSTPQHTIFPEPTLTPTPSSPFNGKLFFDMNGSGLQDESSFLYDPDRLADLRQPLQPDLIRAINDYLSLHPDLTEGDLITIPEPGLSGYQVCLTKECTVTENDGSFLIPNNTGKTTANIKIVDPNNNNPALAMRYINEWKGIVVIEPYMMNGVNVPEQNLNKTEAISIKNGININSENANHLGLMQGFLTLPYLKSDSIDYGMSTYYDLDIRLGSVRNYSGSTKKISDPGKSKGQNGTGDTHMGIDYEGSEGLFVINTMEGEVNGIFPEYNVIIISKGDFTHKYGHLKTILVSKDAKIYRGQIIGINGKTKTSHPHIHYGFTSNLIKIDGKDSDIDPYMDLIETESHWEISRSNYNEEISQIMLGSPGYWTVINLPMFP